MVVVLRNLITRVFIILLCNFILIETTKNIEEKYRK
jgi:hypothetical protein